MSDPSSASLQRRLGVFTATAVIMGITIGSGIFRVPSSVAPLVDSAGGVALLWIAGGLVTLCLALSLSELAAMFPQAGGNFVFLRESFGPLAAFLFGWTYLLVTPAGWAAVARTGAEYVGHFVPLTDSDERIVAVAVIAGITIANYRSVPLAAVLQNVATSGKALALALLAILIFSLLNGQGGALSEPMSFEIGSVGAFGVALVTTLWAYEGVTSFCALSGEVRDPGRNLPHALILGVLAVIVLYLLVNAAYAYALSFDEMKSSPLVAADAVARAAGGVAASLVAGLVVLSTFGAIAALALADPRVFYAMSKEGLFFEAIGRVHPRFQTPYVAVTVAGTLACIWVSFRNFEELANTFVLGVWPFHALAVLGVIRLRRTRPDAARPYRTLGYPLVPIIFLVAALWLLTNSLIQQPKVSLLNVAITLAGVPVYFIWRRRRAATAKT
jgi:amino acid transporter